MRGPACFLFSPQGAFLCNWRRRENVLNEQEQGNKDKRKKEQSVKPISRDT